MATALPALTEQQKRMLRDYLAPISNRPPGFDVAALFDTLISGLNGLVSGELTISAASATGTAAVGSQYDGKPVWAMINQAAADGTLVRIERANIAGGTLTVTGNTTATAGVTVRYLIDARA